MTFLSREGVSRAKVLSNTIKQKRKEKAVRKSLFSLVDINGCILG